MNCKPEIGLAAALIMFLTLPATVQAQERVTDEDWNQRIPTLVPQVGHSVARLEVTRNGKQEAIGGFCVGQPNWIVTLGQFVDDQPQIVVSFKHTKAFPVTEVVYRDPKSNLVVVAFESDLERKPLVVGKQPARLNDFFLFFNVPEYRSVGLVVGYARKPNRKRNPDLVIDAKIDHTVPLSTFTTGGTVGLGTPIFSHAGDVIGIVAATTSAAPFAAQAIGPTDLNRVIALAIDPNAVVAESNLVADMVESKSEAEPPALTEDDQTAEELRTWAAANGKFSTEARFIQQKAGKVQLEQKDGKKIVVSIERLSEKDQKYLHERE